MGLIHPVEMWAVSVRMLKAACRKLVIKMDSSCYWLSLFMKSQDVLWRQYVDNNQPSIHGV